jgi:hypothetical protein
MRLALMLAIADLQLARGGGTDWAFSMVVKSKQGSKHILGLLQVQRLAAESFDRSTSNHGKGHAYLVDT